MSFYDQLMLDFKAMQDFRVTTGYKTSAYDSFLLPFIKFCGDNYPSATCITKEMIDDWLEIKLYRKINSKGVFISCLRQYTKYINAIGNNSFVPDSDYAVRHERFTPFVFTDSELTSFFNVVDSMEAIPKSRKRDIILPVLFRMIYCCGMRPGEPLRLKCKDLNLKTGDIYIRQSKGSKDRHIIMSEDMRHLCIKFNSYMGEREWFFQDFDGNAIPIYWLDRQFHICWNKSKFPNRGNPRPYDLRHAFATRNLMKWLDNGEDIMVLLPYLSAYLGHTHLQDTLYYIHLLPERLRYTSSVDWAQFEDIYGGDGCEKD